MDFRGIVRDSKFTCMDDRCIVWSSELCREHSIIGVGSDGTFVLAVDFTIIFTNTSKKAA